MFLFNKSCWLSKTMVSNIKFMDLESYCSHVWKASAHLALIIEIFEYMVCLCIIKECSILFSFFNLFLCDVDRFYYFIKCQLQLIQFFTLCFVSQFKALLTCFRLDYLLQSFIKLDHLISHLLYRLLNHKEEKDQAD